jgi:hypothetical protein
MVPHKLNHNYKINYDYFNLESIVPQLMEGFEKTYHPWIIFNAWK